MAACLGWVVRQVTAAQTRQLESFDSTLPQSHEEESQRNNKLTSRRACSMFPVVSSSSRQPSKKVMVTTFFRTARIPMVLKENSTSLLSRRASAKQSRVSCTQCCRISWRKWVLAAIASKSGRTTGVSSGKQAQSNSVSFSQKLGVISAQLSGNTGGQCPPFSFIHISRMDTVDRKGQIKALSPAVSSQLEHGGAEQTRLAPQAGARCWATTSVPTLSTLQVGRVFFYYIRGVGTKPKCQAYARNGSHFLTRNFGLLTLKVVKHLQRLVQNEHRSLNRQNLALCHSGMRWDNSKTPNSNIHYLKTQARGSVGRAARR